MTGAGERIGVFGAGAWGTALAQVAAQGGSVELWAREPEVAAEIEAERRNSLFLPGALLHPNVRASDSYDGLMGCATILVVTPAQHMRAALAAAPLGANPLLVLCSKGIEAGSGLLMSEVAQEVYPDATIAVLSGPTFAGEVAAGLPTAVTLACADADAGAALARRLSGPSFRPYLSSDVIGAEVGGAVKNVLAIACGVVEGRGLGLNARAALIARGFAEMTRFGLAKGARPETLTGLAGLGDLVLTCSSENSRNFSLGKGIGAGARAADLLADRVTVAEGAATAPVLAEAAAKLGVDMPIVEAVNALLSGRVSVDAVVERLLARPLRNEGV